MATLQSLSSPLSGQNIMILFSWSDPQQDPGHGHGSTGSYLKGKFGWKDWIFYTYPSSRREELMLCASCSRSPSALVFFTLSLPARSQLEAKNKIIINLWHLRNSVRSGWSWKGVINLSRNLFRCENRCSYEIYDWNKAGVFFINRANLQHWDAYCILFDSRAKPPPLEIRKQNII